MRFLTLISSPCRERGAARALVFGGLLDMDWLVALWERWLYGQLS